MKAIFVFLTLSLFSQYALSGDQKCKIGNNDDWITLHEKRNHSASISDRFGAITIERDGSKASFHLEEIHGDDKGAVWRFFLGQVISLGGGAPIARYGTISYDKASLYISTTSHGVNSGIGTFSWAGKAECLPQSSR